MLIDKLNYYVDKKLDPDEEGGLLHAYQLTNKLESFDKLGTQSGLFSMSVLILQAKLIPLPAL